MILSAVVDNTTSPNNDTFKAAVTSAFKSMVEALAPNAVSEILPAVEVNVLSTSIDGAVVWVARTVKFPVVVAAPKKVVTSLRMTLSAVRLVVCPTLPKNTLLVVAGLIARAKPPFNVSLLLLAKSISPSAAVIVTSLVNAMAVLRLPLSASRLTPPVLTTISPPRLTFKASTVKDCNRAAVPMAPPKVTVVAAALFVSIDRVRLLAARSALMLPPKVTSAVAAVVSTSTLALRVTLPSKVTAPSTETFPPNCAVAELTVKADGWVPAPMVDWKFTSPAAACTVKDVAVIAETS